MNRGIQEGIGTAYQPLENYGIIGDLHTVALVGMDGSIDYMCFPNFDSPTIFAALLDDDKGGRFKISPAADGARHKQLYIPDTNVLLTRFLSMEGVGEITDYMPVEDMRHTHILVRRVKAFAAQWNFGWSVPPVSITPAGAIASSKERMRFSLSRRTRRPKLSDCVREIPLTIEGDDVVANFTLNSNEAVNFILETADAGPESPTAQEWYVRESHAHTVRYWRDFVAVELL